MITSAHRVGISKSYNLRLTAAHVDLGFTMKSAHALSGRGFLFFAITATICIDWIWQ